MRQRRAGRGIAIGADIRLRQQIADRAVGERLDQRRRQIDRGLDDYGDSAFNNWSKAKKFLIDGFLTPSI
jgi:hypothetical protein